MVKLKHQTETPQTVYEWTQIKINYNLDSGTAILWHLSPRILINLESRVMVKWLETSGDNPLVRPGEFRCCFMMADDEGVGLPNAHAHMPG